MEKMKIHRCPECNNYTLKDRCPKCMEKTINPHPARYSPLDPYGKYRRQFKRQIKPQNG
jgi:H/ACA ribonucleoprotein complex subunit 3